MKKVYLVYKIFPNAEVEEVLWKIFDTEEKAEKWVEENDKNSNEFYDEFVIVPRTVN